MQALRAAYANSWIAKYARAHILCYVCLEMVSGLAESPDKLGDLVRNKGFSCAGHREKGMSCTMSI